MSVATLESPSTLPIALSENAALRMSYEEFLDWLDEDKHAEWVDGEVIMHSPVSSDHSDLNGLLSALLRIFVEKKGLGKIYGDPFQMKTSPTLPSRAPDLLFLAKEHRDRLRKNLLEGAADLVVEIISPESRGRDRGDKFREYEQGGVREYWLLDPERQRAEFYLMGADGRYTRAPTTDEGRFYSIVLAGVWLQVDWLWQDPLPTVWDVIEAWGI